RGPVSPGAARAVRSASSCRCPRALRTRSTNRIVFDSWDQAGVLPTTQKGINIIERGALPGAHVVAGETHAHGEAGFRRESEQLGGDEARIEVIARARGDLGR